MIGKKKKIEINLTVNFIQKKKKIHKAHYGCISLIYQPNTKHLTTITLNPTLSHNTHLFSVDYFKL